MAKAHGKPGNWAVKGNKKRNETNEQLIRRSKQQTQKKRTINEMRNKKFHNKKATKRIQRLRAIDREAKREANERAKLYS